VNSPCMVRYHSDVFPPRLMSQMGLDFLYKDACISLNPNDVLSTVQLPYLLSNVLLVYRITAIHAEGQSCLGSGELNCYNPCCSIAHHIIEPLLPPLLEHASFSEAHFHSLAQSRPLLLHTHTGAPFIIFLRARLQSHSLHLARLPSGIFTSTHRLVGYVRPRWCSILDSCARMGCWYRFVGDVYRYGRE